MKITARAIGIQSVSHRSVVGGHPLNIAWRQDRSLAGIATADADTNALTTDLAAVFGVDANALADIAITDWTHRDHIWVSYLVYRPGQLVDLAPALRRPVSDRLRFAGSDFSGWPNSMEGAVRSGQQAVAALVRS